MTTYRDLRRELFVDCFERGLSFDEFASSGNPAHAGRWRSLRAEAQKCHINESLVSQFVRRMPVLVLAATWCGDCVRQGALIDRICHANPLLECRFLDNKAHESLQEELRINGAEKIPVVVALSEDFYEIARLGDAPLSAYRRKAAASLGGTCDPGIILPPLAELEAELDEWVQFFERAQYIVRLSPRLRRVHGD